MPIFRIAQIRQPIIVEKMLTTKLDKHTILNVNLLAAVTIDDEINQGKVKLCRQEYAKYEEDF